VGRPGSWDYCVALALFCRARCTFGVRVSVALLLACGTALATVAQTTAKEGVVAHLENPAVLRAAAGRAMSLVWTLRVSKEPFSASGIYVRLRRPNGSATIAEATELRRGRYRARLVIPRGGVRSIAIALRGWVSDARGTRRADLVFPIENDPTRP
jgi:hypothetical protein